MKLEAPRPPLGATPEAAPRLVRQGTAADRADPHPLYCVWEITLACDLGCKHCGSRAGAEREGELTTAQCLDVVDQLADLGFREVTLIGGEAYLREDWDQIAAAIRRKGMLCGITTGARNLDAERVARAVDAGVSNISVSIDGLERTHDAQRGSPGSWRAAVAASRRIAATPIRLSTNTQVNRLSLPELCGLADLLVELGSRAWQIQLTVPMGRGADRPDLPLQPYELLEFFPLLDWLKTTRLDPAGVTLFPGNNVGYFGPYEARLRYGGAQGAHWSGCGAGKWCIGVEADGAIKACPSLPTDDWTGAKLPEARLGPTLKDAPELTYLKNRTVDDLWGYCRGCYYADVCKAGCTWTSQCILGKPGNNPYCIHRAMDFERRGLRERLTHTAAAPGRPFDHGRFALSVEDMPAAEGPLTIGGRSLEDVAAVTWDSGGVWTDDELRHVLRRIGRREPVVMIEG